MDKRARTVVAAGDGVERAVPTEERLAATRDSFRIVENVSDLAPSPQPPTVLKQSRAELAYVLNNWRKHREDRAGVAPRRARVDPYSSGVAFPGWRGRVGVPFAWPRGYEPLPVSYPTTWLLTDGWKRWGAVGLDEAPGPKGGRA